MKMLRLNDDALYADLSAYAKRHGHSVTFLVQHALRAFLEADETPTPAAAPLPRAVPRARPAVAPPPPDAADDTCLRCGHPKDAHFARGCVMACPQNCSEKRYQAPL